MTPNVSICSSIAGVLALLARQPLHQCPHMPIQGTQRLFGIRIVQIIDVPVFDQIGPEGKQFSEEAETRG